MFRLIEQYKRKRTALNPNKRFKVYQKRKDWAGLCQAYYDLGVQAMNEGDLHKAALWLNWADTIYSARDEIFDKVDSQLIDDCSDRISELEDEDLLYNTIPLMIEEMAEDLTDEALRLWGLLSLARMVKLGQRLAVLPGCGALSKLGWAVDLVQSTLKENDDEGELPAGRKVDELQELCGELYALGDNSALWGLGSAIDLKGRGPFHLLDLCGMMLTLLEMEAYLSSHVQYLRALAAGEEPPEGEMGVIAAGLLLDYYVRTHDGSVESLPQVKAELARIKDDYDFVSDDMSWAQIAKRIAAYKELSLL